MRIFFSLIKKESIENIRTKKMLGLLLLFIFIGLISPLTAKLTPQIFQAIATDGIDIKANTPTEIDSWVQFFKNVNQIGMFGLVIMFSTQVTNEIQKGTLINLLSKGLPRYQVIMSKWFFNTIMWFCSYCICFLVAFGYTKYFFGNTFPVGNILMASLLPLIFGIFLISLEILGSVITENVVGTLIFVASGVVIQFILSLKDEIVKYMPIALLVKPINIIKGIGFNDYFIPIFTTFGLIIICIISSIIVLNKKEMS
ncbi:MAG: ABC transporter permease [Peptoanaerobacter stomatis]|uniref:ABC transporter permease n=1 Tax=Peptoanaerobacter stomatis TaxID=796937 RepID=UPI003FA12B91